MLLAPRRPTALLVALATALALLVLGLLPTLAPAQASEPDAQGALTRAWRLAEQSGRYQYRVTLEQSTYPAPSLHNAGRAPQQASVGVEGSVDLPAETLEMTLWPGATFDPQQGLAVRVEQGQAWGRMGTSGAWEPLDGVVDGFAPGNDPLGFLAAATQVAYAGEQTTSFGSDATTRTFQRYTFLVEGQPFAAYMQGKLEAQLRTRGELPAGLSVDAASIYARMTGTGELWLRADGLPAHLALNITLPDGSGQRTEATISNDYWDFDEARLAAVTAPFWAQPTAWLAVRAASPAWGQGRTTLLLALSLLLLLLGAARLWRSPRFYAAFASAVVATMLVGPLLSSERVQAAGEQRSERHAQQQARRAEGERQAEAQRALQPAWNAQADPRSRPALSPVQGLATPHIMASPVITSTDTDGDGLSDYDERQWNSCAMLPSVSDYCDGVTDSTDTDGDGLTDGIEVTQLGTIPHKVDSDGDTISDTLEVEGFLYNGTMWYLNPSEADTNFDGRPDSFECPQWSPISGDYDPAAPCPDTDGDGTPNPFDSDNDGDGVPDDADLSPDGTSGSYSDGAPLALTIDNLTTDKPAFVTMQFRPTRATNLHLQNVVLDWPSGDTQGHIQRTQDTTFATTNSDAQASDALAGNGDLRLTPLLEITMPYSDGHYANLPVLPAYRGVERTSGITVGQWLDQEALDPFGVSVNPVDGSGDLVAYVPLTTKVSQTGDAPVAFQARMPYHPSQDGWGNAHEYRVVWLVQILQESDNCVESSGGSCTEYEEALTIVHVYGEEWTLSGLEVSEEWGTDVALLFEDPVADDNPTLDDHLWTTSWNMNLTFLDGVDCDTVLTDTNNIATCQGDEQRDVRVENLSEVVDEWSSGAAYIAIWSGRYDDAAAAQMAVMTTTLALLTDRYGGYQERVPTFLMASEHEARSLNMEVGDFATLDGSALTLDLEPSEVQRILSTGMSWRPYEYDSSDGWRPVASDDYLGRLATHVQADPFFQPTDESVEAAEIAESKTIWAQMYYAALLEGLTQIVGANGVELWTETDNFGIPATDYIYLTQDVSTGGLTLVGGTYAGILVQGVITLGEGFGAAVDNVWLGMKQSGDSFALSRSATFGVGIMATLFVFSAAAITLYIVGKLTGNDTLYEVGRILLTITAVVGNLVWLYTMLSHMLTLLVAATEAGVAAANIFSAMNDIANNFQAFPASSLVIALVIVVAILIYMLATLDLRNPATVASIVAFTIAQIVVTLLLFVIGLIPIAGTIFLIVLSIVDAILLLAIGTSTKAWLTEAIAESMISDANFYLDMDDPDRLSYDVTDSQLVDPEMGFVQGNAITMTMDVTNTVRARNSNYLFGSAPEAIRRSAFQYHLQPTPLDQHSAVGLTANSMRGKWRVFSEGGRYSSGELVTRNIGGTFELFNTGINAPLTFRRYNDVQSAFLTEAFAIPYSICVDISWPPGVEQALGAAKLDTDPCFWGTLKDSAHINLGGGVRYDVLPPTVGEFFELSWNGGALPFPNQRDQDGDGLLATAQGGADANDRRADADGDGLLDPTEMLIGSPAASADGDKDGLNDAWEQRFGTDPYRADTDGDGLSDYTEKVEGWLYAWQDESGSYHQTRVWSDPLLTDEDEDTLNDLEEFIFGTHPQIETDPSFINDIIQMDEFRVDEVTSLELLARFEERGEATTFYDSSGNDNNFSCVGAARCAFAGEAGRYGNGLRLTTSLDPIYSIDAVTDFAFADFSIAVWLKGVGDNHTILSIGVDDSTSSFGESALRLDGGVPRFSSRQNIVGNQVRDIWGNTAISDDEWHHIAVTWDYDELADDGRGVGRMWLDGVDITDEAATDYQVNDPAPEDAYFYINSVTPFAYISGSLDELTVWSDALDAAAIRELMAARYNPNDGVVRPGAELRYSATISNTHGTQGADGHIVATSEHHDPALGAPVHALRFEGADEILTFANSTGESSTATCRNDGSCPTLGVSGQIGSAARWDGVDDIAYVEALGPAQSEHMLTFWLNVASLPATGERAYLLDSESEDAGALDIYLNEAGNLVFEVAGAETSHVSSYAFTDTLNSWAYVQWAFDNDSLSDTRLWIDDLSICCDSVVDYTYGTLPDLLIGRGTLGNSVAGDAPFHGRLDQLLFYDEPMSYYSATPDYHPTQEVKEGNYWPTSTNPTYPTYVPDGSPMLLLEWNSSDADHVGYYDHALLGRTFTCQGNQCPAREPNGLFGAALRFDGNNDSLQVEGADIGRGDYAASLWFKSDSATQQTLLAAVGDNDDPGILLALQSDGTLQYLHRFPVGTSGGDSVTTSSSYNDGTWHHVVATTQGNTMRLYVDGALVGTQSTSGSPSDEMTIRLGRLPSGGARLAGTLDELMLFPSAVDADGVALLMQSQLPALAADDPFVTFDVGALSSRVVSGTMQVEETLVASRHRVVQEAEAALNLSQAITIPVVDDNAADLVNFFPFEDVPGSTRFEDAAQAADATCSGDHCPVAGPRGYVDRAAFFDGDDDYLLARTGTVGTIAVWVKADRGTILEVKGSSRYHEALELDVNRLVMTWSEEDGSGNDTGYFTPEIAFSIRDNLWTHLVVTHDASSEKVRVYLDGVLVGTMNNARDELFNGRNVADSLVIGRNREGYDVLHGYLDDLRLYQSTLSAADVQTLYSESAALMRWEFDEPEEATVFDDRVSDALGTPSLAVCAPLRFDSVTVDALDSTISDTRTLHLLWEGASALSQRAISTTDRLTPSATRVACGGEAVSAAIIESDTSLTTLGSMTVSSADLAIVESSGSALSDTHTFTSGSDRVTLAYTLLPDVTYQPNPAPGTDGKIGNTALFNGAGHISVEGGNADQVAGLSDSFTVMAWIQPEQLAGPQAILGMERTGSNDGWSFGLDGATLLLDVHGQSAQQSAALVEEGAWTHVAATVSGGEVQFFVDGVRRDSLSGVAITPNSDDGLLIGATHDASGQLAGRFNGQIDELALYGRALSDEEMISIYLRELRWYRAYGYGYITVDSEAPEFNLLTDAPYRPAGYIQLAMGITDTHSTVELVQWGLRGPSDGSVAWQSATQCVNDALLFEPAAWCPSFIGDEEGAYTYQLSARDSVANEATSPSYTLYVDDSAPVAASPYSGQWLTMSEDISDTVRLTLALTGTLSDPDLPGGFAGSGVYTPSVTVVLADSRGAVLGEPLQQATLSGDEWSIAYEVWGVRPTGLYTIALAAEDNVGNRSHSVVGTVMLDQRAPQMDLNSWQLPTLLTSNTLSGTLSEQPQWGGERARYHFEPFAPITDTVFFDNSDDESHLTCSGGSCPASRPGLWGEALFFDGVDDVISATDPYTSSGPLDLDTFTLSLWVNPATGGAVQQALVSKGAPDNSQRNFHLYLREGGTGLALALHDASCAVPRSVGASDVLTLGEWQHVAATYDGAQLRLFVGGEAVAELAHTGGACQNNEALVVGADLVYAANRFRGSMDELRVWGRALAEPELHALQQSSASGIAGAEVALKAAEFITLTLEAAALDWQPVTVAPTGGLWGEWVHTLDGGLEDFYTIYGRGSDAFGNASEGAALWTGAIDMAAPRVTMTVEYLGSGDSALTAISWQATDLMLHPGTLADVCSPSEPTWATNPHVPLVIAQGSNSCWQAGHSSGPWVVTLCDIAGHCTTESVASATSGAPRDVVALLSPESGTTFPTRDPIAISGSALSPDGLDTLVVTMDGTPLYSKTWSDGTLDAAWSFDWTPDWGTVALVATLTTDAGALLTSTLPHTITVHGSALSLTKTVTPTTVVEGEALTYTLLLHNDGPGAATALRLTDLLPDGISGSDVDQTLTVSGHSTLTLTVPAIASGAAAATITNTATFTHSLGSGSASAAVRFCGPFDVTSGADSGAGSLREAVGQACDGSTVRFTRDLTVTLASPLTLTGVLTLDGDGYRAVLDGAGATRLLDIAAGAEVTLRALTLTGGSASAGGAIRSAGTLTIERSTLFGNSADVGGAIWNGGALALRWSTLGANQATSGAGAVEAVGGTLLLENVTVSENVGASVGGIASDAASTLHLTNALLAGNSGGPQCVNSGTLATDAGNLITDHSGCGSPAQSGDPLLGALGDVGGTTWTFPLLPGSPAIHNGTASCTSDQRGQPQQGGCDIGSVESQGFTLSAAAPTTQEAWINSAFAEPLAATVTANNALEPVAGGALSLVAPSFGPSLDTNRATLTIGADGVASRPSSANGDSGTYSAHLSSAGGGNAVTFTMTNLAADVTVTKAIAPPLSFLAPGAAVTYTLNFSNEGNGVASGVVLTDLLPSELEPLSYSASGATITPTAGLSYSWQVAPLAPGEGGVITLFVRVADNAPFGDLVTNRATVSTLSPEVAVANNQAAVTTKLCTPQTRLYVDASATGAGDGSSWVDALPALQDALALARECGVADDIWVAAGRYYPDEGRAVTDDDPTARFELPGGVRLYGGFAGTERVLAERDVALGLTILSGDIGQDDAVDSAGVVTTTTAISGTNSQHVVWGREADGALLDGFTITAGDGTDGAGLYELATGNYANLHFSGNRASGSGGAIYHSEGTARLANSRFTGNEAAIGAALYQAALVQPSSLQLSQAEFRGNHATSGSAIYLVQHFAHSATLNGSNLLLLGNADQGGGTLTNAGGTLNVVNATIAGNDPRSGLATRGYAVLLNSSAGMNEGQTTLRNALVWGNSAAADGSAGTQELWGVAGAISVTHSLIETGCAHDGGGLVVCSDVLTADPLLFDVPSHASVPTQAGNVRLLPGSPALDAGDTTDAPTVDLRGAARPSGAAVDIGAYEAQGWTLDLLSGDGQSTQLGTAFPEPLVVQLSSHAGLDPVGPGGAVTFRGPTTGASLDPTTVQGTTDGDGLVSVTATANGDAGSYSVSAEVAGGGDSLAFALTNVAPSCADSPLVTSNADSGAGSLRQALADGCAGATIRFEGDRDIALLSPLLVDRALTIDGEGQRITLTLASGAAEQGILHVAPEVGPVTLAKLRVVGGRSNHWNYAGGLTVMAGATVTLRDSVVAGNAAAAASFGQGGILNRGALTVEQSQITDNRADGRSSTSGAGIYSDGGSGASLVVRASHLAGNVATNQGGALYSSGVLTVTHSTLMGNQAASGAALYSRGPAAVRHSTLSGNVALSGGGAAIHAAGTALTVRQSTVVSNTASGEGAGLLASEGTLTVVGSIVAANQQRLSDGLTLVASDCATTATLSDGGSNVVGEAGGCPTDSGTTQSIAQGAVWGALLEPLGDYGGGTQTHALKNGSAAIDAGGACGEATDQRGQPRGGGLGLGNGACDIGAYEAFSSGELAGDVSCDGTRNSSDGLLAFQFDLFQRDAAYLCPLAASATTLMLPACDGDQSGKCNSSDSLLMLQCDMGVANALCPASTPAAPQAAAAQAAAPAAPAAPQDADVTFQIGSARIASDGMTATVALTLTTAPGVSVGAFTVQVDADPTVATSTACTFNSGAGFIGGCNATIAGQPGATRVVGIAPFGNSAAGGVWVAEIEYTRQPLVSEQTTALTISIENLVDTANAPLTGETVPGTLTVEALPTAVTLAGFAAEAEGAEIVLRWETLSEQDNLGFHLLRGTSDAPRQATRVTEELIPSAAPGSGTGAAYEWRDDSVAEGTSYFYWLEAVDMAGQVARYGPVTASKSEPTAVRLSTFSSQPTGGAWRPTVALLGLALLALRLRADAMQRQQLSIAVGRRLAQRTDPGASPRPQRRLTEGGG